MGHDEDENELPHVFTRTFTFSCSFINFNPSVPFRRAFYTFFLCVCFIMNQPQVMKQELTWAGNAVPEAKNDVQPHVDGGYSHRVIIKIHRRSFSGRKTSMKMLLLYVAQHTASDGQLLSYCQ